MEFEQVIRLVEAVSKSGLTDFDYEEGNLKLHMGKKGPKAVKVTGSGQRNRECGSRTGGKDIGP